MSVLRDELLEQLRLQHKSLDYGTGLEPQLTPEGEDAIIIRHPMLGFTDRMTIKVERIEGEGAPLPPLPRAEDAAMSRNAQRALVAIYRLAKGRQGWPVDHDEVEAEIKRERLFDLSADEWSAYRKRVRDEVAAFREAGGSRR